MGREGRGGNDDCQGHRLKLWFLTGISEQARLDNPTISTPISTPQRLSQRTQQEASEFDFPPAWLAVYQMTQWKNDGLKSNHSP